MKLPLLLAAALVATPAYAAFQNGDALYKDCSSQMGSFETGFCVGYIAGVVDSSEKCIPIAVKLREARDVVLQYLRDHPEKRHLEADALVLAAIQEAFCK